MLVGVLGCSKKEAAPANKDGSVPVAKRDAVAVAVAADAPVIDAPKPEGKVFVHGAGRCGECHEKMFDEWEVSAHARSASSPLYKAAVANAKDTTCDRCHAPLEATAAREGISIEGVTCDVCHTLREPMPRKDGANFRLAINDMVKFGPRCDLDDHYFHRMGCSPEHQQAALCGSCHWWEPKGLPVLTEFADWRDGPAGKAGTPCQDCHMPKEKAVIATGSPKRAGVPHHGLLGLAGDLRKRALGLEVTAKDEGGALHVVVAVTNAAAGHAVPAGLPERRLHVRVRVVDPSGAQTATATRQLGRLLVDDTGAEVPFWRATKVGSDTRIAAGATWSDAFTLGPIGPGTVEVEVVYRGVSDAIATLLAVETVEEHVMAKATVPLAKLPRTVTVKPPAAGKRKP